MDPSFDPSDVVGPAIVALSPYIAPAVAVIAPYYALALGASLFFRFVGGVFEYEPLEKASDQAIKTILILPALKQLKDKRKARNEKP